MSSPDPKPRYRVEVRLSAEERSQLESLAHQRGLSMSDYIRQTCLEAEQPVIVTDIAIKTYWELHQLSTTLSQLLHQLQQAEQRGEALHLSLQALQDLLALLHQVRAEVAGIRSPEASESGVQSRCLLNLSINL